MKPTTIAIIVLASLLAIVTTFAIINYSKVDITVEKVEYERIMKDMEKVVSSMKNNLEIIKDETLLMIYKIDSVKAELPKHERNMSSIRVELKKLNDAYIYTNYNDSTITAIIGRLSRR